MPAGKLPPTWRRVKSRGHTFAKRRREYAVAGRRYPRVYLAVYRSMCGVYLVCGGKDSPGDDWEERGVPAELLSEAIEILREEADDAG